MSAADRMTSTRPWPLSTLISPPRGALDVTG